MLSQINGQGGGSPNRNNLATIWNSPILEKGLQNLKHRANNDFVNHSIATDLRLDIQWNTSVRIPNRQVPESARNPFGEATHFQPPAITVSDRIAVLYRAEDDTGQGIGWTPSGDELRGSAPRTFREAKP